MDGSNDILLTPGVGNLVARQPAGHSLLREFYCRDEVYRLDCERVWRKGWLFAGHACEIKNPGDYFTLEVDNDSIIVMRDRNGEARALHNVCRHRGSLICENSEGHVNR